MMTLAEQIAAIVIALLVTGYLGKIAERLIKAAERSATANELTALYARELCWRVHDLPQKRNGRGELMRWQDPAEIYGIASDILADADQRAEGKRRREAAHGPDPLVHEGTDFGPEAEAAKAESAANRARFDEALAKFSKPSKSD